MRKPFRRTWLVESRNLPQGDDYRALTEVGFLTGLDLIDIVGD